MNSEQPPFVMRHVSPKFGISFTFSGGGRATFEDWAAYEVWSQKQDAYYKERQRIDDIKKAMRELKEEGFEF